MIWAYNIIALIIVLSIELMEHTTTRFSRSHSSCSVFWEQRESYTSFVPIIINRFSRCIINNDIVILLLYYCVVLCLDQDNYTIRVLYQPIIFCILLYTLYVGRYFILSQTWQYLMHREQYLYYIVPISIKKTNLLKIWNPNRCVNIPLNYKLLFYSLVVK